MGYSSDYVLKVNIFDCKKFNNKPGLYRILKNQFDISCNKVQIRKINTICKTLNVECNNLQFLEILLKDEIDPDEFYLDYHGNLTISVNGIKMYYHESFDETIERFNNEDVHYGAIVLGEDVDDINYYGKPWEFDMYVNRSIEY